MTHARTALEHRARACGVLPRWRDTDDVDHDVPAATLEVLVSLVERDPGPASALPPVVVAWDGVGPEVPRRGTGRARWRLELEAGGAHEGVVDGPSVALPGDLPPGRHRLVLGEGDDTADVLSAPRLVHPGPLGAQGRAWGVFHPTATLWSGRSRAIGDLGDLGRLADWARDHGAQVVSTLPLLAGFPSDPSPYAPVSRRFWNEVHVDLDAVAPAAWRAAGVSDAELVPVLPERLVDHGAALALRRRPLTALARHLRGPGRATVEGEDLARFVAGHPDVEDYAAFRARLEGRADDPDQAGYHLVGQWLMDRQLCDLARRLDERGQALALDLPVGAHAQGYDVWRQPELFAVGATAGAPPDDFFTGGQDWGFPPLHPRAAAHDRWRHLEACLEHQAAVAGLLRIDHVMAIHRLFWVPEGASPTEGAYVRYPTDELVAVVSLVAHRHGTGIVGEDLGTVPPEVTEAMGRHAIRGMHVVEFDEGPAPAGAVASVGTHDLATFATWWAGLDAEARERLGGLGRILERLGEGEAGLVLVDVADLWAERQPVNVPGTGPDHPNWRRRAQVGLEHLDEVPGAAEVLERLEAARQRARDSVASP